MAFARKYSPRKIARRPKPSEPRHAGARERFSEGCSIRNKTSPGRRISLFKASADSSFKRLNHAVFKAPAVQTIHFLQTSRRGDVDLN